MDDRSFLFGLAAEASDEVDAEYRARTVKPVPGWVPPVYLFAIIVGVIASMCFWAWMIGGVV